MAKKSNEEKTIGDLINYDEICFVICPIGEDDSETRKKSNQVIENLIEPAAQINNLKVLRSDNLSAYGRTVTNQIIDYLLNSNNILKVL